jgi:hypothetical protein
MFRRHKTRANRVFELLNEAWMIAHFERVDPMGAFARDAAISAERSIR